MDAEVIAGLRRCPVFFDLSESELADLAAAAAVVALEPGEVLIREGAADRDYFVLLEGELEVRRKVRVATGVETLSLAMLQPGDGVGELALLSAVPRRATVAATKRSRLMRIDGSRMDQLLAWSQYLAQSVMVDAEKKLRHGLLRQAGALRKLPLPAVQQAIDRLRPLDVPAGRAVVRQGEVGDYYYIIETGRAEVWRADAATGESHLAATLGSGDAFGEEALLIDGHRNATVTMVTAGRLWALAKDDFNALVRTATITEIGPEEARHLLDAAGARLIDCRHESEWLQSRIPGATLIPLDHLRERLGELAANEEHIIYCNNGVRSGCAAFLLIERGFKARPLTGGLQHWGHEVVGPA